MRTGFFFALAACFVWGLIFIVPHYLPDFSPVEIALGRYFSFGIVALLLMFRKGLSTLASFSSYAWRKGLLFGLFSGVIYYFGVVIGVRYATAPLTVLILGLVPLVVALYGNWYTREWSLKQMWLPFLLVAVGMVLVNVSAIDWSFTNFNLQSYLFGILGALAALGGWAWFAVDNARFLRQNKELPREAWANFIGIATFVWILALIPIFHMTGMLDCYRFLTWDPSLLRYYGWMAVLGVICSWLGCYLWNQASIHLPLSMMGFFIIFETLFGLFFVYLSEYRLPNILEFSGTGVMLGGILLSVWIFNRLRVSHDPQV